MADIQGANVNIWYVNGDGGADNTTSNRGEAYDNAWDTIQFAFDKIADGTVNDGDEIRICKTSDDATHYGISSALNPAWDRKEVTITGANTTGQVDNTQITITATSAMAAILDIESDECERTVWANIYFNGNSNATNCVNSVTNNNYMNWLNCKFSNATSHGVYLANTCYTHMMCCRFNNNGGDGLRMDGAQYSVWYKCLFDNNTTSGVDTVTENAYRHKWIECVFYNNGTIGFGCAGAGGFVANCIFDSNTTEGLNDKGSTIQTFRVGNIYSNNGQGGVNYTTSTDSVAFNELFYNNLVDTEDNSGGSSAISELAHIINYIPGASAENPNYTDAANLDFTPKYSFGAMGTNVPTPYQWMGSTADDIGLNKWVNTESISII